MSCHRWSSLFFIILLTAASVFSQETNQRVSLTAALVKDTISQGDTARILLNIIIAPGLHINARKPLEDFLIPTTITFDPLAQCTFGPVIFPQPQNIKFPFSELAMSVYAGRLTITSSIIITTVLPPGPDSITGSFRYQACSNISCFAPQTIHFIIPFTVIAAGQPPPLSVGTAGPAAAASHLDEALTREEQKTQSIIQKGLVYALIAFFLFGLALNLTPCVYPVIPITISYFSHTGEKRQGNGWTFALSYVVGIAIVFASLGLVSSLAGKQWGFLFQNIWFTIAVALLLLAMAASMFGSFEITLPSFFLTRLSATRHGMAGAFVMGLTVGFLIAPCAAGIIVGLIGVVAKMGLVVIGTLLFFVMGLGLGAPYLVLAMLSEKLSVLPRSGLWMVWVKKCFGIILIGLALYFLIPHMTRAQNLYYFLFGIVMMFGGLFLGFLDHAAGYSKVFKVIRSGVGVVLVVAGIVLTNNSLKVKVSPHAIDWLHYQDQPVAEVLVTELMSSRKPVLIDFYADWCAPCRKLNQETFTDAGVIQLSRNWIFIKIDCTAPNENTLQLMRHYKITGLPTLIFIDQNGIERQDLRTAEYIESEELLIKLHRTFVQ
jgi:thioredoxin:protein disulfide reductase